MRIKSIVTQNTVIRSFSRMKKRKITSTLTHVRRILTTQTHTLINCYRYYWVMSISTLLFELQARRQENVS